MKRYTSDYMEAYLKNLWKAIKALAKLLDTYKIQYTIIGGVARNQYGYSALTEDIDILVAKKR